MDGERARREDAWAADVSIRDSVLRTARRFLPLVSVIEDAAERVSTAEVSDDDAVAVEEEAKRSFAGWGIAPPGNDADRRIGSSLHSGHISDPLPYACIIVSDLDCCLVPGGLSFDTP